MKPLDLLHLLVELFGEKAALRSGHAASAQAVGQYDFNNTYQYVIAREDQHLSWLGDAIRNLGGAVPDMPLASPQDPARTLEAQRDILAADARSLDGLVARWQDRVASVSDARNRLLLQLVLGEAAEHARLFRQASDGRLDLLGRRTGGDRTDGQVMPTRWVE